MGFSGGRECFRVVSEVFEEVEVMVRGLFVWLFSLGWILRFGDFLKLFG